MSCFWNAKCCEHCELQKYDVKLHCKSLTSSGRVDGWQKRVGDGVNDLVHIVENRSSVQHYESENVRNQKGVTRCHLTSLATLQAQLPRLPTMFLDQTLSWLTTSDGKPNTVTWRCWQPLNSWQSCQNLQALLLNFELSLPDLVKSYGQLSFVPQNAARQCFQMIGHVPKDSSPLSWGTIYHIEGALNTYLKHRYLMLLVCWVWIWQSDTEYKMSGMFEVSSKYFIVQKSRSGAHFSSSRACTFRLGPPPRSSQSQQLAEAEHSL